MSFRSLFSENCAFENHEEAIVRDIFIAKMLDNDIQCELLKVTVEPKRTLSIAVNIEMGHQNQQRISSNNNRVNATQQFIQLRGASARVQQQNRTKFNRESNGLGIFDKTRHRHHHIVGFALLWVRIVTVVDF